MGQTEAWLIPSLFRYAYEGNSEGDYIYFLVKEIKLSL
jgi:hypothetical protein